MMLRTCFECGRAADFEHHVVPRARGGTQTVPLCGVCHAKAHHRDKRMSTGALTATALQHKKARGEWCGGWIPYGWALDADGVHLTPAADEQKVIRLARERRAAGLSLRKVAAELERMGILTRAGRPWQATQIARALSAEVAQ